jgi:hypothetical protein
MEPPPFPIRGNAFSKPGCREPSLDISPVRLLWIFIRIIVFFGFSVKVLAVFSGNSQFTYLKTEKRPET